MILTALRTGFMNYLQSKMHSLTGIPHYLPNIA